MKLIIGVKHASLLQQLVNYGRKRLYCTGVGHFTVFFIFFLETDETDETDEQFKQFKQLDKSVVKTSLAQPEVPTFGRPEAELQAEHRLLPSAREQGVPLAQHPCELK
jgi:hypothetical protein